MHFPINYNEPVYRPPSEANSFLLPITNGCSHNKCTFCTMYNTKKYFEFSFKEIKKNITDSASYFKTLRYPVTKIFLCDGDALGASTELLLKTLEEIKIHFPKVRRVSCYATVENLKNKSEEELKKLSDNNLNMIYIGMESGNDTVLDMINKGNSQAELIENSIKAKKAGFKLSMIAMLGLGGKEYTDVHAKDSAFVFSSVKPDYFSFLTTIAVRGTQYRKKIDRKEITQLSIKEHLIEMRQILELTNMEESKSIFRANHISNEYQVGGTFPKDKGAILNTLDQWISQTPDDTYMDVDRERL